MSGTYPAQGEKNLARIVQSIRDLFAGRNNACGSFTITVSAATTTVTATNCSVDSKVLLTPTSASAAAEAASTYVSAVSAGSFTVTHPNNATADRTFSYAALG